MKRPDPILVADRFAPLRSQLLTLLASLGEDEWDRPIAAPGWSVKDVTAHLLGAGPEVDSSFASLDPLSIRDATGRPPGIHGTLASPADPYFLAPVLDTFVRALPYNFRHLAAPEGTVVRFEISGDAGGVWFLHRVPQTWILAVDSETEPAADVVLPQDTAWRLFTKGINREEARTRAVIRGDAGLASPIFATTAIIG